MLFLSYFIFLISPSQRVGFFILGLFLGLMGGAEIALGVYDDVCLLVFLYVGVVSP